MKRLVYSAILIAGICGQADARDVLTVQGGVVCLSPFRLSEGIAASNRGDPKWASEVGCIRLKGGLKGVVIGPITTIYRPLQVRIFGENDQAGTFWGYADAFSTPKGGKLLKY